MRAIGKIRAARVLAAAALIAPVIFGQTPPAPPTPPTPARPPRVAAIQESATSYLGLGVREMDADRAKALALNEARGVEVKNVVEGSAAAKAGIKEGDVVLEFNGQQVEGVEQFTRLVRETPPGRQVKILVWRNGAEQTLGAAMGTRSQAQGLMQNSPWFGGGPMTRGPITIPSMPPMDFPQFQLSWQNPVLGIEGESVTSQLADFFGVKDGVLVRSVTKNSAAEKAGIKAGDVIVKVDDSHVASTREITAVLRGIRDKKSFPVTVVRNRQEMTITVTVDGQSGGGVRAQLRTVQA